MTIEHDDEWLKKYFKDQLESEGMVDEFDFARAYHEHMDNKFIAMADELPQPGQTYIFYCEGSDWEDRFAASWNGQRTEDGKGYIVAWGSHGDEAEATHYKKM